ncbi:MAG: maleylpyruvate isomerase family mycothiol-dependent enzyme [Chloroflexi bacterium]|nr:maleylpyruvate isomerase family mycothiol-dependent enzyme [Chloroflexota bacterium]
MAILRDDPVQLIAQEQVRLLSELKKLPEAAWQRQSHCEGWTNARVVAHLIVQAEAYQQAVAKGIRGDTLPPSIPGGQRLTVDTFRERSRNREASLAGRARAELLPLFDKQSTELVDLFRRVAPQATTKPAWHPSGNWTIAMYISMRVYELALHGWDIHVSLEPSAVVRPQLQPFLIHFLLQTGKRFFDGTDDLDGIYRFELQGSQSWTTRIFNGKLDYGPIEPSPDAVIRTDPSHFLLLASCRENLRQMEQRGQLRIEGDRERTEMLLRTICRGS